MVKVKYTDNRYSVQLARQSSIPSGETFYNSHIIKPSMAAPLANEAACQNAGDALGGLHSNSGFNTNECNIS